MSSKPEQLDEMDKQKATLDRELMALQRDEETGTLETVTRIDEIKSALAELDERKQVLTNRWEEEKGLVNQIVALRDKIAGKVQEAKPEAEPEAKAAEDTLGESKEAAESVTEEMKQDVEEAVHLSDADRHALIKEIKAVEQQLHTMQAGDPLVHYEVTPEVVGRVVADWTGIPVGDMVKDEATAILTFEEKINKRIKGQQYAIHTIAERVKAAKAGLNNPHTPLGVFLAVGPSGVGKTECGIGIADLLFGGERFMCTINMSEFQEKHTVSRLVGSPPGYVGYGEGGVLTEAVRQRPYSVVLLDEAEKADLEVMNLFYQVFDKGTLADGEGRVIDFKNTIVMLTSNLASDIITEMCSGDEWPEPDDLIETIRPVLSNHFKPALLARMEIIPFLPISREAMTDIVKIKLNKLAGRMMQSQKLKMVYDEEVVHQIAQRCTEVETGARNIDYIVNKTLLPRIATEVLNNLADEREENVLQIGVGAEGDFTYEFAMEG
jgi:type VI secretion system protein VasG